jgi:hypothetical protein
MNITIIAVDKEDTTKGKATWQTLTVTYKDKDNKATAKKLMSFSTPKEVWETLANSSKGDTFSVMATKDDKGYWQWSEISRQDAVVGQQTPPTKVPIKPTYETPEERAQKQIYIIRQSSIASAVDLLKDHGKQPNVDEVLKVARAFEAYVTGNTLEELLSDEIE